MYLVFACDYYYPSGGWDDFKGGFTNKAEAEEYCDFLAGKYDKVEVIDTDTKSLAPNQFHWEDFQEKRTNEELERIKNLLVGGTPEAIDEAYDALQRLKDSL